MKPILLVCVSVLLLGAVRVGVSATGYQYAPDVETLALWHFNEGKGDAVKDESKNSVESILEGAAKWDKNEEWNTASTKATSLSFDGKTQIVIPNAEKAVQPKDAITVEAWVNPAALDGWKLICAHWGGAVVGSYHLGVEAGIPKFHVNTDSGTGFAAAAKALKVGEWQHVAGTYDGSTIRLYVDGVEAGTANHKGKLLSGDPTFDVVIASKASREFQWNGLMDEVRISGTARTSRELSPNLNGPQAVEFRTDALPVLWGAIKSPR